ncbi:type I-B CRISPR-associated protein Cas5b [Campylobacter geochelonis]|uniref:CRISPR-associated protein Cas5, hmari subtype n=1 Tax=Campylobacter geochelonis TaxID=1780362 RepID=A0A128EEU5_9BACT|nr:type I-B CRISPR-associated protein Cas5b [Campylobacter geochelonis]QKF70970.1 CRISPR/Cas system-associated RAMP protein Cas5, type I-B [Campylobacter geochelonis]CZE47061.1 CRISPR-associated protein Cas5%2C hmari subtype [Campylobacter geochelonis]
MQVLSFKLSGKFAHFKKPDVNEYAYFTYNNIPKPTLLGLLGAIIGLGGYTQKFREIIQKDKNSLLNEPNKSDEPEFYERLKHLKICIIPLVKFGRFSKKIQVFNNSVGYASSETGGNLIVREQWLENPSWRIMIQDDESEEFKKISNYLCREKAEFIPYLGKNDHFANISEIKKLNLTKFSHNKSVIKSLYIDKNAKATKPEFGELGFLFHEFYPLKFDDMMFYELEKIAFTNYICELLDDEWFEYDGGVVCFV